jgi:hypothetical protein
MLWSRWTKQTLVVENFIMPDYATVITHTLIIIITIPSNWILFFTFKDDSKNPLLNSPEN